MAKEIIKKELKEEGVIVNNLVIRPIQRQSQDIGKWRTALQNAEGITPVRVPLYDLYADIFLDTFLTSLIEKRVLGVTKTKLSFVGKDGKENEEITNLIACSEFRSLRKEIQMQKFWGISLIEINKENDELKIFLVPVKHVKPWLGKITYEQYGTDGIDYRLPPYNKYLVEIGKQKDLGLLLKAAPYVIYKRGDFGDWAQFAEIFGMPFREATYDGYNEAARIQLEQAMEAAGAAPYIVHSKDSEITIHEQKNNGANGELYNALRRACNEELSVLILGQTETTTSSQSSGYAQAKEHGEVEEAINFNDQLDEISILNEKVKPILANLGYKVADGLFVHVPMKAQLNLKDKADTYIKLKVLGKLPIDDDFLYDEFGIPKPTDYNQQKADQAAADEAAAISKSPANNGSSGSNADTKKPTEKKVESKLSAFEKLRLELADFFALAPKS
jgi:hypothetical protein